MTFVGKRPDTDDGASLRQLLRAEIFSVEIRKHLLIAAGAARRFDRAFLDPAETIEYVERPTAELAEFAIADDVDSGLLLSLDYVGYGLGQAAIERGLIDFDAVVDRLDVATQFRRTHQAANMSRGYAVLACRHDVRTSPVFR